MSVPRESMRIANFIPALSGGGAERQLRYVADELTRRGHEVLIAYTREGFDPWVAAGVSFVHFPTLSSWDPRLLRQAASTLRSWNAHVLQTWGLQMDVVGGLARGLTGTPWILREPTSAEFYGRRVKPALRCAIARRGASAVIANSSGGLAYWSEHAPRVRAVQIPNAVNVQRIDQAVLLPGESRPRILFVGRLEASKRVNVLIEAVAELQRERELTLDICGDGADRIRLQQAVREAGLGECVRFPGYIQAPWSYMKSADVFVSLSEYEGSPNAVLEAFAARVPVLLSDIPAHREVADETCAWFAPPDASSVAAVIRSILSDPAGARARVDAARRRVESFSIGAVASQYERLYADVVKGTI